MLKLAILVCLFINSNLKSAMQLIPSAPIDLAYFSYYSLRAVASIGLNTVSAPEDQKQKGALKGLCKAVVYPVWATTESISLLKNDVALLKKQSNRRAQKLAQTVLLEAFFYLIWTLPDYSYLFYRLAEYVI